MIQFLQMLRVPAASAAGFGIQAGMHKSVQRDIANSKILFELLRTLHSWTGTLMTPAAPRDRQRPWRRRVQGVGGLRGLGFRGLGEKGGLDIGVRLYVFGFRVKG